MMQQTPEESMKAQIKLQEEMDADMSALAQNDVQMCDFKRTATCSPDSMHESCTSGLDNIAPMFSHRVNQMWESCASRRPCNDACPGIVTMGTEYMMSRNMFSMKSMLSQMQGTDIGEDARATCSKAGPVKQCFAKPECSEYVANSAMSMVSYVVNSDMGCDVYTDPCYEKSQMHCKKQLAAALAVKGSQVGAFLTEYEMCPGVLAVEVDKLGKCDPNIPPWEQDADACMYPPWIQADKVKEMRPKCCSALAALNQCMAEQGCGDFTEKLLTPDPFMRNYMQGNLSFSKSCGY